MITNEKFKDTIMTATQLVQQAKNNPETWQSDGIHEDEVIFANNTFSVGSNGDVADYATEAEAIEALEYSWSQE